MYVLSFKEKIITAAEFVVKDVQLFQAKHFEFDVPNDFLVMSKDWRSIKGNSLV
ncbi:hypothetical protein QUC31_006562 [Theobroma cacao]